ncbi:MAG TPA: NAD+ synthase [Candidatus Acidoferrales bacterium]|nr:NAD+ synthase [Candidatus Acidoferrales bacterium]
MKIALAQFNPTVGDFDGNSTRIFEISVEAKRRGADLAVFSELSLCGYLPLDLLERPAFIERNRSALLELAHRVPLPAIIGYAGRPHESSGTGKPVANAAALVYDGRILFEQQKMLLPTYDVFDESRYFQPAKEQFAFSLDGTELGVTICEDIWNDKTFWAKRRYERDPVNELVGRGANVIINVSASPYTIDKRNLRTDMLRALARAHGRAVIYVNQVGGNDSLIFDGSSIAITGDGRIAARAKSFEEDVVIFDTQTEEGDVRPQPEDELEAAYLALVCGTRDYVRKCGFSEVIIGLSGGIDSAVVATIAAEAMGKENVLGVSMPGPYSSESSFTDAKHLAENLGIRFTTIPIGQVYQSYLFTLKDEFAGRPPDVTEENIQARIRGNFLMALSNKFGSLVLSTGNKSELAVGYCTLYGDMAGGLAVISDVPKTMVYALANCINRRTGRELIPENSIIRAPSAELRPNQTDQDSLPPYDLLDRILKAYIEDVRSPREIADRLDIPLDLVRDIASRVDRAEYKRKQSAPGLKITSRAFGFGRPFPIAQRFRP